MLLVTQKTVMKAKFSYLLVLVCFFIISCEEGLLTPEIPIACDGNFSENSFQISIQDEYTTLPGKVSVFFKVDDKNGKPIARLNSDNFSVYEKGRNDDCYKGISAFESNARISPNAQIFRYNTMLVLDLSGSVLQESLNELKNASQRFVENIMPAQPTEAFRMGIWWFDGEDKLHELQNFTSDRNLLTTQIANLNQNISGDPSTDLYGAVVKSTGVITDAIDPYLGQGVITASSVIIFTDGTDQAARYSKDEAINAIQDVNKTVNYYTIGLGDEIDQSILQEIGESGSIIADSNEDLEDKFNETADLVFDEANSFYLFEYCSPKRDGSGTSGLILQVNLGNTSGYIETSFDGTGFSSGCE